MTQNIWRLPISRCWKMLSLCSILKFISNSRKNLRYYRKNSILSSSVPSWIFAAQKMGKDHYSHGYDSDDYVYDLIGYDFHSHDEVNDLSVSSEHRWESDMATEEQQMDYDNHATSDDVFTELDVQCRAMLRELSSQHTGCVNMRLPYSFRDTLDDFSHKIAVSRFTSLIFFDPTINI